jgi:hypothetical protein
LYDELIKNYNQANVDDISPMAQLHNDAGTIDIFNLKYDKILKQFIIFICLSYCAVYKRDFSNLNNS